MQIYFGPVSINELESTEGTLVSSSCDTHTFFYGVEYGSNVGGLDEVAIYDGLDRFVPIDIDSVPALIRALNMVYDAHMDIANSAKALENLQDPLVENHII